MLSLDRVRRIAAAAQGYGAKRSGTLRDAERVVRRLGVVQLDSIATVDRSHRLVLAARLGRVAPDAASRLLAKGRVLEHWAHEASLLPAEAWPLLRRRMREGHPWWAHLLHAHPGVARRVLRRIRAEGPLASRDFDSEEPRTARPGGFWELKLEKRILDCLWSSGKLVIARRDRGFQRVYDLPERVLPSDTLRAPVPTHAQAMRTMVLSALGGRGVLTERAIVEHWRLRGGLAAIRPAVRALERAGDVRREAVDDGGGDVLLPADADDDPPEHEGAVLLSPFDNLLWDRAFVERFFGFRHSIEVFKPAPQRRYGYYVMPLLRDGKLAGRADVKADRERGTLSARAWHPAGAPRRALDEALAALGQSLDLRAT